MLKHPNVGIKNSPIKVPDRNQPVIHSKRGVGGVGESGGGGGGGGEKWRTDGKKRGVN